MRFYRETVQSCPAARGAVVVIDVIRAFTTAAVALAAGASEVVLVASVEEAFDLRRRFPEALIMGEVDGLKVDGFDFGNSPAEVDAAGAGLSGRRLIQRTGHGTQGAVRSAHAGLLLAASFACAGATAARLRHADDVSFVVTGALPDESFESGPIRQGDEDAACADYLEALLRGETPDPQPYLRRVWDAPAANKFLDPEQRDFSPADLDYCTRLDAFGFAMEIRKRGDLLVMTRAV